MTDRVDLDLSWSAVRTTISKQFGEAPGPTLESEIINAFEQNPAAVINASEEVANALHAGEIHSGWPILRKRIERITNPLRDVTVQKPNQRAKAITRAEQWIKTAGIHFGRETEIEDELFGDRGILKDWPDLQDRILDTWRQARPTGQQLEADLEERSERWKATTGVLWNERATRRLLEQQRANDDAWITDPKPDTDLPAELQPQETT